MAYYQEIVRNKLKIAREEIGYTQREVAKQIGEPSSKIAKIEVGTQMPDVETLGKLAELYEVSFDWLFGVGKKREQSSIPGKMLRSQTQIEDEAI